MLRRPEDLEKLRPISHVGRMEVEFAGIAKETEHRLKTGGSEKPSFDR